MRGEVSGIRRRLDIPGTPIDFPILQELRAKGITDYVAMPIDFSDGSIHAVTFSTDRPGGFTTEELGQLYDMLPVLGRLMEIHATRHTARILLDTYVGRHAGERVLKGLIKRGDGETIHAVIWFSDLRGSTRLADTLPQEEFLILLNDYFECMASPVLAHGGTVLRYVGDAVLAIFPIDPTAESDLAFRDAATACTAAVDAARDAMARVAAHNSRQVRDDGSRQVRDDGEQGHGGMDAEEPHTGDTPEIRFGLALHLGDVMYGNIGVPERLEFTVIGPAANEAARLEDMCKTLDRPVLLSANVADQLSCPLVSLGFQAFRGVQEPQEVFTFPECDSTASIEI
jgi:adenylate cyclase